MSQQVHVTIDDEHHAALGQLAEQTGAPKAELIRRALRDYLRTIVESRRSASREVQRRAARKP